MSEFTIDERLFQRGQTWSECQESWIPSRTAFLAAIKQATPLPGVTRDTGSEPLRVCVYYNPFQAISSRLLPAIGVSFDRYGIAARYFDEDIFFPRFYSHLGRVLPCIFTLDPSGRPAAIWRPDPAVLGDLAEPAFARRMAVSLVATLSLETNPGGREGV